MTILPDSIKRSDLRFTYQWAALNLPLPASLSSPEDKEEWNIYAASLPPEKLLARLGEALDKAHDAWYAGSMYGACPVAGGTKFDALAEQEQLRIFSLWESSETLLGTAFTRFGFNDPDLAEDRPENTGRHQPFWSDHDRVLFRLVNFMKGVHSADLPAWEDRREKYRDMISDGSFRKFTDALYDRYLASRLNPSGPAPV